MRLVAQAAACPADATRKASTSSSFYRCVSRQMPDQRVVAPDLCTLLHTFAAQLHRLVPMHRVSGHILILQLSSHDLTAPLRADVCVSPAEAVHILRQVFPSGRRAAILQRPGAVHSGRGVLCAAAGPAARGLRKRVRGCGGCDTVSPSRHCMHQRMLGPSHVYLWSVKCGRSKQPPAAKVGPMQLPVAGIGIPSV